MNRLVNKLKQDVEHKKSMLKVTAPTSWFKNDKYEKEKQKLWELKEALEIKELEDAINCLIENGF